MRKDAKRQIVRYGLFTLPPAKNTSISGAHAGHAAPESKGKGTLLDILGGAMAQKPMDPNGVALVKRSKPVFCKYCTVLAGEVRVVFEDGSKADVQSGVHLHHVAVIDLSKRPQEAITSCDNAASSIVGFLAAGIDGTNWEFTSPDGKYPSGFNISKDTCII